MLCFRHRFVKPSGVSLTVTGQAFHYDATKIAGLNDGDLISTWQDLSGSNRHATASGASRATFKKNIKNGNPVARFAGAQFFNTPNTFATSPAFTIIAIANATAPQSLVRFQDSGTTYMVYPYGASPGTAIESVNGPAGSGLNAGMSAGWKVGVFRDKLGTNTRQTFVNNQLVAQGNSASNAPAVTSLIIGAYQGTSEFFVGDVGELIYYPRWLSDAELYNVWLYGQAKWGIADWATATAQDWKTRAETNGGAGCISDTEYDATLAFLKTGMSNGWGARLTRWNPFLGANLSAARTPVIKLHGAPMDGVAGIVELNYSRATGITNSGGGWMDTGNLPYYELPSTDLHFGIYNRSSSATGGGTQLGSSGSGYDTLVMFPNGDGTVQSSLSAGYVNAGVLSAPYGHIIGTRTSSTEHCIYRHGALVASSTGAPGGVADRSTFVFGMNYGTWYGSPDVRNISTHNLAGYHYGYGLTAAQVLSLTRAMETFQRALGRSVNLSDVTG